MKKQELRKRYCASAPTLRSRKKEHEDPEEITGRAIVFNQETVLYSDEEEEIREVIAPEAVTRELLDASVILMTLYHNPERVLARSRRGEGTLSYDVDAEGVSFSFTPPATEDGRTARELVGRGDITGCSFAFRCFYGDPDCVEVKEEKRDGKKVTLCTIRKMESIHDFTLTPTPAYEQTEVEARELRERLAGKIPEAPETWRAEAARLRAKANEA